MEPHRLSRPQARRIAVQAQLLDAPCHVALLEVVRHLTLVQVEPTAAQVHGSLVELRARLRPARDIALYRAKMAAWPGWVS